MKAREFKIYEYGDQHNVGLKAERTNGSGGWDDVCIGKEVIHVIEKKPVMEALRKLIYFSNQKECPSYCGINGQPCAYCNLLTKLQVTWPELFTEMEE